MNSTSIDRLWTGGPTETPIGLVWAAVSDLGLAAIKIGGEDETFLQGLAARHRVPVTPCESRTETILRQVKAYLLGQRRDFDLPIHWELMSAFQQKALRAVHQIPYGETRTYGQIAAQIGKPLAPRAVGGANATNPMPLVIPCHRLVGADGSLRGYGGGAGLATKTWLLDLETSGDPV